MLDRIVDWRRLTADKRTPPPPTVEIWRGRRYGRAFRSLMPIKLDAATVVIAVVDVAVGVAVEPTIAF